MTANPPAGAALASLALAGRRAVVMGLGRFGGGVGAARYLAAQGARVLVTDLRHETELAESLAAIDGLGIDTQLGGHAEADFATAEIVVANPAVHPDHPLLAIARESGAKITSAIELLLRASPARSFCVSGTHGKSSTCHAVTGLLHHAGFTVHAGGNIGGSLLDELDTLTPTDVLVLELSSYQLEVLTDFEVCGRRVEAAALTNVRADHLERHGSVRAYRAAKERILDLVASEGARLVPADEPELITAAARHGQVVRHATHRAAGQDIELFVEAGEFRFGSERLGRVDDLRLPGTFQVANVLVALGLARLAGAEPAALAAAIPTLAGLPHRMEDVGIHNGRRVIDNSVSTTPDSTLAAVVSLPPGCTLIAGGQKKDLPLEDLAAALHHRAVRAVTFGHDGAALAQTFERHAVDVVCVAGVEEALVRALSITPRGGDILFSPACASFDAYPNFMERALAFRAAVRQIGAS